jgi:hypothetical protein
MRLAPRPLTLRYRSTRPAPVGHREHMKAATFALAGIEHISLVRLDAPIPTRVQCFTDGGRQERRRRSAAGSRRLSRSTAPRVRRWRRHFSGVRMRKVSTTRRENPVRTARTGSTGIVSHTRSSTELPLGALPPHAARPGRSWRLERRLNWMPPLVTAPTPMGANARLNLTGGAAKHSRSRMLSNSFRKACH